MESLEPGLDPLCRTFGRRIVSDDLRLKEE